MDELQIHLRVYDDEICDLIIGGVQFGQVDMDEKIGGESLRRAIDWVRRGMEK